MRLDKFLKVSRILKRRTVACDACKGGKVEVNNKEAKPSAQLKVGDKVTIRFAGSNLSFVIKDLPATVRKEDADKMYEVVL
ncbi:MAG: RNA-binding S4 domain-containing protein [Clostridia bacterium]